ncbi:YVTN repeat-like/Quino protein amine dehydrogenase [Rhizopogon salebrosus TDB-379]|nr:YVTN repeat-like/Quino protein amine dehydrogenase [Rhizopogon salebrosus TDB-379]
MSLVKRQSIASKAMRHTARADKLPVVMTLEGHGPARDNLFNHVFISYFPDGKQMFSGSRDGTSRRWNLETGKEIDEVQDVCEQDIGAVAVSRDGRWVISTIGEDPSGDRPGEIKARDVETEVVKTFKGYSLPRQGHMMCIDISVDSKLLVSGAGDGFWIWSLDTGKLLAGPSEFKTHTYHHVEGVRFSQDSTKLAVIAGGSGIEVWDTQAHKLHVVTKSGPARVWTMPGRVPLFWTTKDRTIVAAITWYPRPADDDGDEDHPANMINELDALTLENVGAPFEGHTGSITSLALSLDCALLASASRDGIKLWAFKLRQLLASFDVHYRVCDITFSPNSQQLAYSEFGQPTEFGDFGIPTKCGPPKVYICDIPPNILARIWPEQEAVNTIEPEHSQLTDQLNSDATRRPAAVRRHLEPSHLTRRPRRPSPAIYSQQPTFIHQLRKLLPSSFRKDPVYPVHYDERRDLLDVPATSHLSLNGSPSGQAVTQVHSGVNYDENPRRTSAGTITQSSATASTTGKAQRHLLSWWSSNIGRAPIAEVPLAQGQLRVATSGAPRVHEDDLVRAEDFDSSNPSPNPNLQQPSEAVQINTGEHRSRPFCFCLQSCFSYIGSDCD